MLCSDTLTPSGVGANSSCRGAPIGDSCMVFCAEEYRAVSNDTSTVTCAYNSSDNTVDWEGDVPLCLVVNCDVIASLRVDFSKCFSLACNETCVVHCSVGYTGVDDKNTLEFKGDSDVHLHGSESLELSTVQALAELVLPREDHFVQTDGDVSGTQMQTTAACSLCGKKGSSWATNKEVADKTILQHQVAGVGCQLRSCSRAESKSRRLGILHQRECLVSK